MTMTIITSQFKETTVRETAALKRSLILWALAATAPLAMPLAKPNSFRKMVGSKSVQVILATRLKP